VFYLTRMLGKPVVDAAGEAIGAISDVAIATREVFPRVTSLAFLGPEKPRSCCRGASTLPAWTTSRSS